MKKINVLLITPDQMRADHLSCYGYKRKTSPNIDALAEKGVLFSRNYAVGSWTTPTFPSMLTSLTPSQHGATLFGSTFYDPETPLLPEQFEKAGYKTAAFCNNGNATHPILSGPARGAIRGIQYLDMGEKKLPINITEHFEYSAYHTATKVFSWLEDNRAEPFYLWTLFIEPHSPYNPPDDHDIFKTDAYPNEKNNGYGPEPGSGHLYRLANKGDEKAVERLIGLYDGKIHFIDYYVGEVLRKLEELGIADSTLIVLTSDHGELLYEHMDYLTFDHRSLYDSNIHVPFIIAGPSVPAAKRIDVVVNQLDLAPTILESAGLPAMDGMQGKSLYPVVANGAAGAGAGAVHEYIYAEQDVIEPLRSVRDQRYKLIHNLRNGVSLLFDNFEDPREQRDVAEERPEVCRRLLGRIEKYIEENSISEARKLDHWRKFSPNEEIIDEVTIGSRFQFYGFDYSELGCCIKPCSGDDCYKGFCYSMEPGDGTRGAIWRSDNPLLGTYNVYIWYGKLQDRPSATNARLVVTSGSEIQEFSVNQNMNTGTWNLLGSFENPVDVRMTNGADGPLVVDAVRFQTERDT